MVPGSILYAIHSCPSVMLHIGPNRALADPKVASQNPVPASGSPTRCCDLIYYMTSCTVANWARHQGFPTTEQCMLQSTHCTFSRAAGVPTRFVRRLAWMGARPAHYAQQNSKYIYALPTPAGAGFILMAEHQAAALSQERPPWSTAALRPRRSRVCSTLLTIMPQVSQLYSCLHATAS